MAASFSRDRLRGHRNGLGLSLADLSERTDPTINMHTIKSYETGRAEPPAHRLGVLADALGIAIDDLYTQHDDRVRDYCAAVASHGPPMSEESLDAAATVLRSIRRRMRAPAEDDGRPPDAA
jgi:transcriptional regulator with XRE-family HTH domain